MSQLGFEVNLVSSFDSLLAKPYFAAEEADAAQGNSRSLRSEAIS